MSGYHDGSSGYRRGTVNYEDDYAYPPDSGTQRDSGRSTSRYSPPSNPYGTSPTTVPGSGLHMSYRPGITPGPYSYSRPSNDTYEDTYGKLERLTIGGPIWPGRTSSHKDTRVSEYSSGYRKDTAYRRPPSRHGESSQDRTASYDSGLAGPSSSNTRSRADFYDEGPRVTDKGKGKARTTPSDALYPAFTEVGTSKHSSRHDDYTSAPPFGDARTSEAPHRTPSPDGTELYVPKYSVVHDQPKSAFGPGSTGRFGTGNYTEDDIAGFPDFKTGKRFTNTMDTSPFSADWNLPALVAHGKDLKPIPFPAFNKRTSHPLKSRTHAIRRKRNDQVDEYDEGTQEERDRERRQMREEEEERREHNLQLRANQEWSEIGKKDAREKIEDQIFEQQADNSAQAAASRDNLKWESQEKLDEVWKTNPKDYQRVSREYERKSLDLERDFERRQNALEKRREQIAIEFGDTPDEYNTINGTMKYQKDHGTHGKDFAADHYTKFIQSDTEPERSRSEWSGDSEDYVRDETSFRKGPRYRYEDERGSGSKYSALLELLIWCVDIASSARWWLREVSERSPTDSSDSSLGSESPTDPSPAEPERGRSIFSRRSEKRRWKSRTERERAQKEKKGEMNGGWDDKRLAEAKVDAKDWAK
ncbi:hypothetical protein QBC34DRAFT_423997 [Podospora aff. communis PSN243]|uniref:Uncharacterized protein n=1 Tax=Podospora aff. communis PSN243 TaxID=3040156 RepID=A0AAV9GR61_9PEZI|nr:hypothetical protein QBC34DRAFT_423997 [Podospora aff. communis PSN243]